MLVTHEEGVMSVGGRSGVGCGANCAGLLMTLLMMLVISLRAFIYERTEVLLTANDHSFPQQLQNYRYIRNAVSVFTINRNQLLQ
jgi:hypothetical protein